MTPNPVGARYLSVVLGLCSVSTASVCNAQLNQFRQAHGTGEQGSKFAWSVAANDQWVVVGIPFSNELAGKVVVYNTNDMLVDDLSPVTVLSETESPIPSQRFGAAVAVSGDLIAVGNCSSQSTEAYCNSDAKRVSVFERAGSTWESIGLITAPPWASAGHFGRAIALSGNWLAVGGARATDGIAVRDVVYLYQREGPGFSFNALPTDSVDGHGARSSTSDLLGHALAMDGNTLLVGARGDDELGIDAGAVHVYVRNDAGEWSLVRKILASEGSGGDNFGYSVALRGGYACVGAPAHVINGEIAGAAYVLDRDQGFLNNWGEVSILLPENSQPGMGFGTSVAVGPERVAVGAPLYQLSSAGTDGMVVVFERESNAAWQRLQTILPYAEGHVNPVGRSGTSVAFGQMRLLIGAPWASITQPAGIPTGGLLVYSPEVEPVGIDVFGGGGGLMWPMPFTDHLFIQPPTDIAGQVLIELTDIAGQRVLLKQVVTKDVPIELDRRGLASGTYALKLHGNGRVWRSTVIAH